MVSKLLSKGATKVAKKTVKSAVETAGSAALGSLFAAAASGTKNMVTDQVHKFKDKIYIPDIEGIPVEEAQKILTDFHFKSIKLLVDANKHYANKRTGIVLKTKPKLGSKVSPDTFIKVFYADETIIASSQALLKASQDRQAAKKEAHKILAHKMVANSKSEAALLSHKLASSFHHKKNNEANRETK
ncbi:hypothetical protein NT95_06210 [Oenococcus kitaharae]|nr:hypothetical protein NT95_06210 [Oenococcus kitaharae]OEY84153.1 hypothetical protein NV75_04640 [Oenococcus kitaharae]OEY84641.1 hypothetical protein NT96_05215 [Oenococcus kitaharae]